MKANKSQLLWKKDNVEKHHKQFYIYKFDSNYKLNKKKIFKSTIEVLL